MKSLIIVLFSALLVASIDVDDSEKITKWILEESFFSHFLPSYPKTEYVKSSLNTNCCRTYDNLLNELKEIGHNLKSESGDLIPVVIVPSLIGNKIQVHQDIFC